jgi:hypothetical protein
MATESREALSLESEENARPEPFGSILGIVESDPNVKLPWAPKDHGGHPRGIEVRTPTTGTADLHRGTGFMSADMGGSGQGSDVSRDTSIERPEAD